MSSNAMTFRFFGNNNSQPLPSTGVVSFPGNSTRHGYYYQAYSEDGRVQAHGIRDWSGVQNITRIQEARGNEVRYMELPGVTDRNRAHAFMNALGADANDYDPSQSWTLNGYRD